MVDRGGDLPSETRTPYHKPDRPQQLFVDFRIDFINKLLIIGLTIEREPEESAMSELGIYEGCYVELRNGDVVGPVTKDHRTRSPYIWDGPKGRCWTAEGKVWNSNDGREFDIIRVMPKDAIKPMARSKEPHRSMCATIPPHVTKAAMDAGIKADPAYEQFVNAILTAGFKAQYGIGFVPVTEQAPIDMDELCERLASALPAPRPLRECSDEMKEKLRKLGDAAVSYLGDKMFPKNESENRIPDSEKPKGGLSGLPFEGVTICFTGSMNLPVDTHKGIAEALGAKVSGSVHSNTTLVVFGVNALSKLDKAIEHDLPRMSESGWLWMAALLGYGKPDHVSPYGKFTGKNGQSDLRNEIVRVLRDNDTIRGIGATADALMEIIERVQVGAPAIPSVRTIDAVIRGAAQVWRQNNPVGGVPPTHYIAKSVHAAISDVAPVHNAGLIPPTGWTLEKETHELINDNWQHTVRLIKGFDEATWVEGKACTLCDAWENARQAARQQNV